MKGRYLSKREQSQNKHIVKRDGEEGEINNLMGDSTGLVSGRTGERKKSSRMLSRFVVGIWNWH